ncbi:MAG TPA: ATP-binding protein, partial [Candidatus Acidoferrum sp.]|nr:ATP-binding protein [Candidatus Acidoferrum sp.]
CVFHCEQPVLIPDNTVATNLFRIAQEAVSNAIKHGQASQIEISLESSPNGILLAVKDNGSGIASDRRNGNGMGLRIMSHRAAVVGGRFSVQRNAAGGTTALCTIDSTSKVLLSEAK